VKKISQDVAHTIFLFNLMRTFNSGKSSQNFCAISEIFKKAAQSKELPNGRLVAQSGHLVGARVARFF
jgi:hypothetical protein